MYLYPSVQEQTHKKQLKVSSYVLLLQVEVDVCYVIFTTIYKFDWFVKKISLWLSVSD